MFLAKWVQNIALEISCKWNADEYIAVKFGLIFQTKNYKYFVWLLFYK